MATPPPQKPSVALFISRGSSKIQGRIGQHLEENSSVTRLSIMKMHASRKFISKTSMSLPQETFPEQTAFRIRISLIERRFSKGKSE